MFIECFSEENTRFAFVEIIKENKNKIKRTVYNNEQSRTLNSVNEITHK